MGGSGRCGVLGTWFWSRSVAEESRAENEPQTRDIELGLDRSRTRAHHVMAEEHSLGMTSDMTIIERDAQER